MNENSGTKAGAGGIGKIQESDIPPKRDHTV